MRIEVTQNDIDRGRPRCNYGCPVALALRRTLGSQRAWKVTEQRIENPDGGRIVAPSEVRQFVIFFDHGACVAPFAFELPDAFLGVPS